MGGGGCDVGLRVRASSRRVFCVCKGERGIGFVFTCGVFRPLGLSFDGGLCYRACARPAWVVALAVGAFWLLVVAFLSCGAGVVVRACVIICIVVAGAFAAMCLPCTPRRPVAPVLAPEALWGSWDI
jgi:hypothetical protein